MHEIREFPTISLLGCPGIFQMGSRSSAAASFSPSINTSESRIARASVNVFWRRATLFSHRWSPEAYLMIIITRIVCQCYSTPLIDRVVCLGVCVCVCVRISLSSFLVWFSFADMDRIILLVVALFGVIDATPSVASRQTSFAVAVVRLLECGFFVAVAAAAAAAAAAAGERAKVRKAASSAPSRRPFSRTRMCAVKTSPLATRYCRSFIRRAIRPSIRPNLIASSPFEVWRQPQLKVLKLPRNNVNKYGAFVKENKS